MIVWQEWLRNDEPEQLERVRLEKEAGKLVVKRIRDRCYQRAIRAKEKANV